MRLGAPLLVWTLILWPGSVCLAHLAAGDGHPPWWQLLHENPVLDTGPMWFVLVLLIFSLAYAWLRHLRPDPPRRDLTPRDLTLAAIAISLVNLLARGNRRAPAPPVGRPCAHRAPPGRTGRHPARSAYGTFVLQGLVLTGLMIAMRPLGVPAKVKAPVVGALGVVGSFGAAWLLVSRTPLGRVL